MITGVIGSFAGVLICWVAIGVGKAGVGMSIMHDANHNSYSKNQAVNRWMGKMLALDETDQRIFQEWYSFVSLWLQKNMYSEYQDWYHYVDIVGAGEGALPLFRDQSNDPHGLIYTGDNGYRVILQSFLFGGLVDWGGGKADLLAGYFEQLLFYLSAVFGFLP